MDLTEGIVGLAIVAATLASYILLRRERNRLRSVSEFRIGHIEALETALVAKALDQQKIVGKQLFDLLLAQQDATAILKDEAARLERELAMAEEQIHVLTPARDEHGRFARSA